MPVDYFQEYIDAIPNKATRQSYRWGLKFALGDPNAWMRLAKRDKRKAEQALIAFAARERDRVSPATVVGPFKTVKLFCAFHEVPLNWARVKVAFPKGRHVANDRGPSKAEIRKVMPFLNARLKAAAFIMMMGARVGFVDYAHVGDFTVREDGIGELVIYRGETEQYASLLTPEAVAAVQDYLNERQKDGEVLSKDAPLIRDDYTNTHVAGRLGLDVKKPRWPTKIVVENLFLKKWIRAKVRAKAHGKRGAFQVCHGFRKWFDTTAKNAGMKSEYVEMLKGRKYSYNKPTDRELVDDFKKAVSALTISEAAEVREEVTKELAANTAVVMDLQDKLSKKDVEISQIQAIAELWKASVEAAPRDMRELQKQVEQLTSEVESLRHEKMSSSVSQALGVLAKAFPADSPATKRLLEALESEQESASNELQSHSASDKRWYCKQCGETKASSLKPPGGSCPKSQWGHAWRRKASVME